MKFKEISNHPFRPLKIEIELETTNELKELTNAIGGHTSSGSFQKIFDFLEEKCKKYNINL